MLVGVAGGRARDRGGVRRGPGGARWSARRGRTTPASVAELDVRFRRWEGPARVAAVAAQTTLAAAAVLLAIGAT